MILRQTSHLDTMKINKKASFGFTLMEIVIYMGLLSIMLVILTGIFLSTLDAQLESQTVSSVEQDGRFILSRLIYDINRAQDIATPVNTGESGNTLVLSIAGVNYNYDLVNGNLRLNINSVIDSLNGFDTTISNLTFQRLGKVGGKNSIKVGFTIASKTQRTSGAEIKNFQTTVALR